MEDLTFGEQVKIILGRKGMTIKELAETIEKRTGKKMSRQNLTQRLGRDNFQEQDMRMIAAILECPFQLSIMGGEYGGHAGRTSVRPEKTAVHEEESVREVQRPTETAETPAAAPQEDAAPETDNTEIREEETYAAEEIQPEEETVAPAEEEKETMSGAEEAAAEETAENMPEQQEASTAGEETDERDMTIGELYEIHEELSELEENAKAGEPVEAIKEELEKPKKERFRAGNFFFRRRHADQEKKEEHVEETSRESEHAAEKNSEPEEQSRREPVKEEKKFEPVISHEDAEEDREIGEINPYTGREYQSNSVRMHPSRIGYVQVYDRSIHKWTDMTEWAFLGYQERKKALLGKAYEPPIYLD